MKFRTPLMAALAWVACCLTLYAADPRVDHVEDELAAKLPGYVRYVPPASEPPVVEPPTTQPADPTTQPVASTPWPLPVGPSETWVPRTLDGAPPYPVAPDVVAAPGQDLAKLVKASRLLPGTYTTSGDVKFNVVGTLDSLGRPTLCTLKLKAGQSVKLPKVFAGVTVTGGSAEGDDMSKDGSSLAVAGGLYHSDRFTGSEGSGLLVPKVPGVQVWYCEVDHNASGSVGGVKADDVVVRGNYVHDNNVGHGRRNTHKFTGTEGGTYADNLCVNNRGGNLWLDNYNSKSRKWVVARNYFGVTTTDNKGQAWSIFALRTEIHDKGGVDFVDNYVATFYSCDETRNALIRGNFFAGGLYPAAIELRNDKRGTPVEWLEGVTITGNTFGPLAVIAPSNTGLKFTLASAKVVVAPDNVWQGDGKPRVTVK